jgi:hypothetical protein
MQYDVGIEPKIPKKSSFAVWEHRSTGELHSSNKEAVKTVDSKSSPQAPVVQFKADLDSDLFAFLNPFASCQTSRR